MSGRGIERTFHLQWSKKRSLTWGKIFFFLTKNFLDIFELQGSGNSYGGQPVLVLRYPNPVQMLGMEQPTADNGLESLS